MSVQQQPHAGSIDASNQAASSSGGGRRSHPRSTDVRPLAPIPGRGVATPRPPVGQWADRAGRSRCPPPPLRVRAAPRSGSWPRRRSPPSPSLDAPPYIRRRQANSGQVGQNYQVTTPRSDFFSATAAIPCPHAQLRLTQPNRLPRPQAEDRREPQVIRLQAKLVRTTASPTAGSSRAGRRRRSRRRVRVPD